MGCKQVRTHSVDDLPLKNLTVQFSPISLILANQVTEFKYLFDPVITSIIIFSTNKMFTKGSNYELNIRTKQEKTVVNAGVVL